MQPPQPITLSPRTLRAIVSMLRDARPYLSEHGSPEAQELEEQMHLMACRLNNDHLKKQSSAEAPQGRT